MLIKQKGLKSTQTLIFLEAGMLPTQKMQTVFYLELALLFVMQTVWWYGAASFGLKLHFLPQRLCILPCLMLCARLSQFKISSKRSIASSTCQIQWLTSVLRFTKTTYWQSQWQNHWNSHHAQSILPSNIITFAVASIHLSTSQVISRSSTYQPRSRLLTYSLSQLMLTVSSLYVKC